MNDFIKKQQELAAEKMTRHTMWQDNEVKLLERHLKEVVAQIIQNTGEELMRLASEEQKKHNCPPDNGNDYDHGAWESIDTLKQYITNLTGAK